MKSKELVSSYFKSQKTSRVPFLPFYSNFAAKSEQISLEEMASDPSTLVNSLVNTREVLNCDWIVYGPDHALEAEALGLNVVWNELYEFPKIGAESSRQSNFDIEVIKNSGRIPVVFEAIKRITTVFSQKISVGCTITGPWTLSSDLAGKKEWDPDLPEDIVMLNNSSLLVSSMARLYCERKVDFVVLNERSMPSNEGIWNILLSKIESIRKICTFYGVVLLFMTTDIHLDEKLSSLMKSGITGIITDIKYVVDRIHQFTERKLFTGVDISRILSRDPHELRYFIPILSKYRDRFFISGNIPASSSVEDIIKNRDLLIKAY